MENNLSRQEDEIAALSSIFGTDFYTESKEQRIYCVEISEHELSARLQVTLPPDYPSKSPPTYSVSAPWLKGLKRKELCDRLEELYIANLGECVVYQWVECIRTFMRKSSEQQAEESQPCAGDESLQISALTLEEPLEEPGEGHVECPDIMSGGTVTDRRSVFQAHLAAVQSPSQVKLVLSKLKENKKIAGATHNIYAYRIIPENSKVVYQDCEDDGEIHAGSRMLHLLQVLHAENVVVIVTRWYGGIHLGPDRYRHINNVAREILDQYGYIPKKDCNKTKRKGKEK